MALSSQKKYERTGQLTDYNFQFFFVKIDSPSDTKLLDSQFVCHERTYYWKTLEEAEEHDASNERFRKRMEDQGDWFSNLLSAKYLVPA